MSNRYYDAIVGPKVLQAEHHSYAMTESKLFPRYLCLVDSEGDGEFVGYFSREDAEFFEKAAALLRALPEE